MVKPSKHKDAHNRKIEAEIDRLKRENSELQAILLARPEVKKGTRRFCCFFGFLLAAGLFSVFSLKATINNDLPSSVQPYANWLLSHPLVPRTARDLASTVLKDRVTSPGQLLALNGAAKKHPVVFVPGFTSSALELWRTDHECAAHVAPRSRIYSGPAMSLLTTNIQCWLGHMSLNASTWKEREGIKVRPSSGLSAADYFGFAMESLFLWGKIIRELGLLGYDENSMYMASYDWRLSLTDLENRDFYFSKLKSQIELLRKTNDGEKVVVVAHSMGSNVFYYFMQWVSAGNGAPKPVGGIGRARAQGMASAWVDENVASVVLVGNSLMGSPKVLNSMLTGNIREVLSLWAPARSVLENVLTRFDFAAIFRSWGSMGLLMPVGGEAIWGNATWSPEGNDLGQMLTFSKPEICSDVDANKNVCDNLKNNNDETEQDIVSSDVNDLRKTSDKHDDDDDERVEMFGREKYMLQPVEKCGISNERRKHVLGHSSSGNHTRPGAPLSVDASHALLREVAPHWGRLIDENYDFTGQPVPNTHVPQSKKTDYKSSSWAAGQTPSKTWANPMASPLPNAPSLTMYCLHGVGVPTDRAFVLKEAPDYDQDAHLLKETTTTNGDHDQKEEKGTNGDHDQKEEKGRESHEEKDRTNQNLNEGTELVGIFEQMFGGGDGRNLDKKFASSLPSSSWGSGSVSEKQNGLPFMVDDTADDEVSGLENGIRTVDGDGTITAFALGLPCGHLWKDERYNPGGASSVLREYVHLSMDSLEKPTRQDADSSLKELHQMEQKLASATAVSCQGLFGDQEGEHGACMAVDLDGDGVVDTHVWDIDGDGVFDATDTTGDGLPEPLSSKNTNEKSNKKSSSQHHHKVTNETIAAAVAAAAAASNGSHINGSDSVNSVAFSSYWDDVVAMLREADLGAFGRGLGLAADHVNILGNNALVSDVLKIATGTANGGEKCEQIKKAQENSQKKKKDNMKKTRWNEWFSGDDVKDSVSTSEEEMDKQQCLESSVKDRVLSKALEAAARVPNFN